MNRILSVTLVVWGLAFGTVPAQQAADRPEAAVFRGRLAELRGQVDQGRHEEARTGLRDLLRAHERQLHVFPHALEIQELLRRCELALRFPEADPKDVVSGDLGTLRDGGGDFADAAESCLEDDTTNTSTDIGPIVVQPGEGTWFLVNASDSGVRFTYDVRSGSQWASRDHELGQAAGGCPP